MKTLEAREKYVEAKCIVRKAQSEKGTKMGMGLEDDFHKNQKKFWKSVKGQSNGSAEFRTVCEENGEYFEELLQRYGQQPYLCNISISPYQSSTAVWRVETGGR